jgi:hypothetical protein
MLRSLLLALALLPSISSAAIVEVEWQWPTRWADDNTAMPLSEIREIVLEHGACNSTGTGLLTIDGTTRVAPPAVRTQFNRDTVGPACLRAYVTSVLGFNSDSLYVPFTIGNPPDTNARPGAPTIVRIAIVWPDSPPPNPNPVVVGRLAAGSLTDNNYVYRRATSAKGYVLLGRAAAGQPCNCADAFEANWPAGTGQYCDVAGIVNIGNTSMVPNGTLFPVGSFTRCN